MTIINELQLSKELIRFPSITPKDAGAIKFLSKKLKGLDSLSSNQKVYLEGRGAISVFNLIKNSIESIQQKAEKKVIDYTKKYKIYCGFHQVEPEPKSIDALSKKGFSMIAYSVDFRMLDVMARSPFK